MKVLKIELQNINSIKSDTPIVIDFEDQRFQDVGLFAITGPTGAGKTTLLDAITIALYRRVPRFEKAGSKGGLEDVVSYGAPSAMARVTFEAQNQRFESQWDIRLKGAKGRVLGKPVETVRLKNLSSGQIIAETKTSCDELIAEITQLNYDQFLRSVMLAQGEFAAFLSARNSEKGMLLQQIAGDEIYRKIGETLRNRIFDERKRLEHIKSKINTDDLLSDEVVKQLQGEKEQLNESLNGLNKELKTVENLLKLYEQLDKLQQQKRRIEADKQQLDLDSEQNAIVFQQLEKHEAAEPFKAILTEVVRLEHEIEKKSKRITEIELELKGLEIQLNNALIVENSSIAVLSESEQNINNWHPKLEKVIELDTRINSHKASIAEKENLKKETDHAIGLLTAEVDVKVKGLELQEIDLERLREFFMHNVAIPTVEKRMSNWNTRLTERKSNWERTNKLQNDILDSNKELLINKTAIKENEDRYTIEKGKFDSLTNDIGLIQDLLEKDDIEKLLVQHNVLNAKKEQMRELIQLSTSYIELVDSQKNLADQKNIRSQKQYEKLEEIEQFETEILRSVQSVKDAEELYEKDRHIVSLEAERKKLFQGAPCALCGSTEHPLVDDYADIKISESKKKLEERKTALEKLISDKKAAELDHTTFRAEYNSLVSQLAKNDKDCERLKQKFTGLNADYSIEDNVAIEDKSKIIESELEMLAGKISEAQKLQRLKDQKQAELKAIEKEMKTLEILLTQLAATNTGIEKSSAECENEINLLKGENDAIERELAVQFADCDLQLPDIEYTNQFIQQLENSVNVYNDNAKKQAEIEANIQQCRIKISGFNQQLASKIEGIRIIKNQLLDLNDELIALVDQRKAILPLEMSTDDKRNELQKINELARKSKEAATNQLTSIKELQAGLMSEKTSINKEQLENGVLLSDALTVLEDKIGQSVFANRKEMSEALLNDELKTHYLQIRKAIEGRRIEISTLEKSNKSELEELETALKLDETVEKALDNQLQLNEQKGNIQQRLGEIAESFRKDREIKSRNELVVTEINRQEQVYRKWTTLMNVLGGSQDAFNTYVQRLTLKNLIDLANLHLYKLNQRYSLQLNREYKAGEELNFKLVDHYQADEMRLVDTSSGGEKFLISLALALGLSDLASYNVSIGSLFIDEGFGTLDSNTLETVISTLETLKAQGKVIGIISHVDSLKERIPVQIQVIKKNNGVSAVEIH